MKQKKLLNMQITAKQVIDAKTCWTNQKIHDFEDEYYPVTIKKILQLCNVDDIQWVIANCMPAHVHEALHIDLMTLTGTIYYSTNLENLFAEYIEVKCDLNDKDICTCRKILTSYLKDWWYEE